jgi:hypothetical protein
MKETSLNSFCLKLATASAKLQLVLCLLTLGGCAVLDLLPSKTQNDEVGIASKMEFNLDPISESSPDREFAIRASRHRLPSPRLEVNNLVRRELNALLKNNSQTVDQGLQRQAELFPVLENVLEDEGLPTEVLNLALIESNFKASSISPAGAAGLWQFMPGTARHYGLEISNFKDERKDPVLSTVAASRYIKNLYVKFDDWYLALAAYNAGDGAISKALSRSKSKDFWSLAASGQLNPETARFVPKFIAASILQKLRSHYGPKVQLAQVLDKHIVAISSNKATSTFALNIDAFNLAG